MTTPVIDTHAHIVPPDMYQMLRKSGAHYGVTLSGDENKPVVQLAGSNYVRPLPMFLTHVDHRIETMDRQGVDMQILTGFHPYDEQRPAGLHDFFLHNCIGYPLATTVAIVRMMFSGVFDRFPDLRVKVPHAGGFLPYQIERFQHAADFRPEPRSKGFKGRPAEVLKRLYYDTITFSPASLRYLIDLVGAERLMLGSDYPFEMGDPDPVASVTAAVEERDRPAVLGRTVQQIMGLNPTCGCHGRPQTSS